jgi:HAD superfamily hydrolase (TIGR01509 family)
MLPISTVLFDLGGVLCRFLPERRLAALAADCGLPQEEVRARIWESGIDAACDRGVYTATEMYEQVRGRLGLRLDEPAFRAAWALAFEPDPAVLALIDAIAPTRRIALLTDNGPVLRDAMPDLFPEIARRLDPMLFSCDLGACKPSPTIFARALDRLGERPERVLFVDDSPAAVAGACAAGLTAVRYTDVVALQRSLRAHLPDLWLGH